MRWQSAAATCWGWAPGRVTVMMKSTQGTTKSDPTVPLMNPIFGSTPIVMPFCASADSPAEPNRVASPFTPDQDSGVGPPGAAQWVMTSWAIFTEAELELMICGLPDVDVGDMRKHTEYKGWKESDNVVQWFWQIVNEMDQSDRAQLLQFVTGTSKVPLEGFGKLQGMSGITRFTIQRAAGTDRLPIAHTCFNQLDLGDYTSLEVMREKMLLAFREGSQGFAFR